MKYRNIDGAFIAVCAPLVVAQELGLFSQQGIKVTLQRQNSWATLRDKVHAGLLDMAQMLAPQPIASHLGLGVAPQPMNVPMVLSYNGNGITLSNQLFNDIISINQLNHDTVLKRPLNASLLAPLINERKIRQ